MASISHGHFYKLYKQFIEFEILNICIQRRKPQKTYENKHLSGPLYDPNSSRPGKIQKTANDVTSEKKIVERPRNYTITVAIPASVVDGAPTLEMKTILAGQVCIHIYNVYKKKV